MEYSVTDYFEANADLKKTISEIGSLTHSPRKEHLYHARQRMKIAADKVDELIEIFTWETTDTDNIRRAFVTLACGIENQLTTIRHNGLCPDLYNGTNNPGQLIEDITTGFGKALKSTGRFQPYITIKTGSLKWKDECLMFYVKDMQHQLKYATFDNLLEAVTYFEKSMLFLQLSVQPTIIKQSINKSII